MVTLDYLDSCSMHLSCPCQTAAASEPNTQLKSSKKKSLDCGIRADWSRGNRLSRAISQKGIKVLTVDGTQPRWQREWVAEQLLLKSMSKSSGLIVQLLFSTTISAHRIPIFGFHDQILLSKPHSIKNVVDPMSWLNGYGYFLPRLMSRLKSRDSYVWRTNSYKLSSELQPHAVVCTHTHHCTLNKKYN